MTLCLKDLDGQYRVTTISDYTGPIPMKSDGVTEVKDGKTRRIDKAGVEWTTVFTVMSDQEVRMESTADPAGAARDFLLTKENGELTHDPVTYTTLLKVARKGSKISLSGHIHHGKVMTSITMLMI